MAYTANVQHDITYSFSHNNRLYKEPHIDPNGKYEIWFQKNVVDVLMDNFKEPYNAYNDKQKRPDRKKNVKEFITKVKKSCIHELIISIGNHDNKPTQEIAHKILKEYYESFQTRNPNLVLVNVAYHADELGTQVRGQDNRGGIHVHLDYIPAGNNYKNGPSKQISETRAYNELGYVSGSKETGGFAYPRQKFLAHENEVLHDICKKHGLEITPHKIGYEDHLKIQVYKSEKQLENLDKAIEEAKAELTRIKSSININFEKYLKIEEKLEKHLKDISNDGITITKEEYRDLARGKAMLTNAKKQLKESAKKIEELERTISEQSYTIKKAEKQLEKVEHLKSDMETFLSDQTLENGMNAMALFQKLMKKKNREKRKDYDEMER